ncbi:MAG: hypothetical protein JO354_10020 [Verrucomicrobia bacterium]|nr:hypothetical protein [Verrucomicrobiota bacterium]
MRKNFALVLLLLVFATQFARGTPSGLNNIPTADTAPQGTFVLQVYSTVGAERDSDFNIGFKTGLEVDPLRFEFGADSHLYPGVDGPVVLQGKVAFPFGDHLPTIAAGVANDAFTESERNRSGQPFGYAVVTEDLGLLRVTAGCGVQNGDALPFVGLDRTFKISTPNPQSVAGGAGRGPGSGDRNAALVTRDLFTLRADAIEQHGGDWLYSAGVLVPVFKYFVIETWGNFPSNGAPPSVTLKGDLVFSF